MDISETTAAKSSQQNYDEYLGGVTRTVTVTDVTAGTAEQPVNLELAEFPGKPYKPNKSMRRILVLAWGPDSSAYVGRRLTIRGNPDVMFGGSVVGGLEIAAMSHIDKPLKTPLTVKRGSKRMYTVNPLPDVAPQRDWLAELTKAGNDLAAIGALGQAATQAGAPAGVVQQIREKFQQVKAGAADEPQ